MGCSPACTPTANEMIAKRDVQLQNNAMNRISWNLPPESNSFDFFDTHSNDFDWNLTEHVSP